MCIRDRDESEEPEEEAPEKKVGESETAYQQRLQAWVLYPQGEEESSGSEQDHPCMIMHPSIHELDTPMHEVQEVF